MVLKIDTTNREEIKIWVLTNGQIVDKTVSKKQFGSQTLLPLVNKILKKNKIKFANISQIKVNTGPGSFTGTRLGVSVANALGFALNIPVNNSPREARWKRGSPSATGKKGKIALPIYEKSKFD